MWPPNFGKHEHFIRHAAGLGVSPKKEDPHKYEHYHYHCDVLIVGSGISGLYAAKIAASEKLQVLVVEQESETGGSILSANNLNNKINGQSQNEWKKEILEELHSYKNVKIITNTTLFAYMHYNYLLGFRILIRAEAIKRITQ